MLKLNAGTLCALAGRLMLVALCSVISCDMKESGTRRDRRVADTVAIQRAVDQCAFAGGGTVYVPARDYRHGQLALPGNVALHLEAGATLLVSAREEEDGGGGQFLISTNTPQVRFGAGERGPESAVALH